MNKNVLLEQVMGFPSGSSSARNAPKGYLPDPSLTNMSKQTEEGGAAFKRTNKSGRKADSFTNAVREHEKLGPKITEAVKRKLSLGARILQVGGVQKIFKRLFSAKEDEKLLKVCQCYLSTTAGPIAGLLFISTYKVAFCSERSIKITSPNGELVRFHYKVLIPLSKIKKVNQSENTNKPSQKYLEIVTVDDFDFWLMGFLNYQKAFKCLQQALFQSCSQDDLGEANL